MLSILRGGDYKRCIQFGKNVPHTISLIAQLIYKISKPTYIYTHELELCAYRSILYNELGLYRSQYFEIRSHLMRSIITANRFRHALPERGAHLRQD